jgi:hypothetical protein
MEGIMRIAPSLVLVCGMSLLACATQTTYRTIDDVPPAADLPRAEQVAAVGLRAKQIWISRNPKFLEVLANTDTGRATSVWVSTVTNFPPETIVTNPGLYDVTVYALAHQWGITQLSIDYLRRVEIFIGQKLDSLKTKQANLAWSNFFLAMNSMGYGPANSSSQNHANRLSNELGLIRNTQATQFNNLLSEYYSAQADDVATLKHRVTRLKESSVSYSKLLEIYRDWLLKAVEAQNKQIPDDARKILEVKVSL